MFFVALLHRKKRKNVADIKTRSNCKIFQCVFEMVHKIKVILKNKFYMKEKSQ